MFIFKQGDAVIVEYDEYAVECIVVMASENGRSLIVAGEHLFFGHWLGMLPLLYNEETDTYEDLMNNEPVRLTIGNSL
jgi:hypothetical protein